MVLRMSRIIAPNQLPWSMNTESTCYSSKKCLKIKLKCIRFKTSEIKFLIDNFWLNSIEPLVSIRRVCRVGSSIHIPYQNSHSHDTEFPNLANKAFVNCTFANDKSSRGCIGEYPVGGSLIDSILVSPSFTHPCPHKLYQWWNHSEFKVLISINSMG
jgi:hypothetical protein